tara:strand:+ start:1194 stop:1499 length:306 start_codon:yes stop_codon:yes gene_type:complete
MKIVMMEKHVPKTSVTAVSAATRRCRLQSAAQKIPSAKAMTPVSRLRAMKKIAASSNPSVGARAMKHAMTVKSAPQTPAKTGHVSTQHNLGAALQTAIATT